MEKNLLHFVEALTHLCAKISIILMYKNIKIRPSQKTSTSYFIFHDEKYQDKV